MAIGASLLVFGLLWVFLSFVLVGEISQGQYDGTIALEFQLSGLILATVGAGLLTYGYGRSEENPSRQG
jgi:hypothetical protein